MIEEAVAAAVRDEIVRLRTRNAEMEVALRPFVKYRAWARRSEWPADIANDPHTPVWGREATEDGPGVAVYVRDFDRAAKALEPPVVVTAESK